MMFVPVVKATMLLVVCFFVLFTASKANSKALKKFGKVIAIILCALAASMIILALYSSIVGYRFPGKMMPSGYSIRR